MSKNHEIELEDLQDWHAEKEVEFASAVGEGRRKSLSCNLVGGFIVRLNGEIVWRGMQPFTAVEEYNKLP